MSNNEAFAFRISVPGILSVMAIYRQQSYLRLKSSRQHLFIEAIRRRKEAARKRAAQNYTPHSANTN